jgi:hypothetical protein
MGERILRRLRIAARSIVIVLALVWLWFGVSSAWHGGDALSWVLHLLLPGGILLITLAVSLKWERLGGLLFVSEGVFFTAWVLLTASVVVITPWGLTVLLSILGVPLLLVGGLLLTTARWGGDPPPGSKDQV